jgi:HTH-type transcriptional regulator, sugar sensing transcriptional regulator
MCKARQIVGDRAILVYKSANSDDPMKKNNIEELKSTLSLLGLKENSKKVFISLLELGASQASVVAAHLDIPKSTIYDALRELSDLALVAEFDEDNKKKFGLNDLAQISNLHKQKINELRESDESIKNILPTLHIENNSLKPKIRFFSGKEGMRQAISDILWYKDIVTYAMWPMQDMLDAIGGEYLNLHNTERVKRNISILTVRPESDRNIDFRKSPLIKGGSETLREVKYIAKSIDWQMSFWIYGDKCIFASAGREYFAFIVHSKEFGKLMKILWQQMWNISKK